MTDLPIIKTARSNLNFANLGDNQEYHANSDNLATQTNQDLANVAQNEKNTVSKSLEAKMLRPNVISFNNTRNFPFCLINNDFSLLISTYKQHKLLSLSLHKDGGGLSLGFTNLLRPMGIHYDSSSKTIYSSNLGNIVQYEKIGSEDHSDWGFFDSLFVPKRLDFCPDIDIHDLRYSNQQDKIFFVSAVYNSILTNSKHKSFEIYWTPKWITRTHDNKLSKEDRCHLNGLALVNGVPKYATAACARDYYYAWKDHHGEGVVIDIETNEIVCDNLYAPHSPYVHKNRLYIGESGTGYFGYVDLEQKKFVRGKFLPGFIRGITFINDFAIITISKDRHDVCFKDIPLGKTLEENKQSSFCGICIVELSSFDIIDYLEFSGVDEIYDIVAVPNVGRLRIAEMHENQQLININ